jgi:hypothetical protein
MVRLSTATAVVGVMFCFSLGNSVQAEPDVAPLVAALSAGDRSVLDAAVARDNADLMTTEGSANFALWSAFAAKGWMTLKEDPQGGPIGLKLKTFALTDAGRQAIPGMLRTGGK